MDAGEDEHDGVDVRLASCRRPTAWTRRPSSTGATRPAAAAKRMEHDDARERAGDGGRARRARVAPQGSGPSAIGRSSVTRSPLA